MAADWPHWRGPAHDGISAEKLPADLDSAEVAWTAEVGIGFATVSVAGERVLTMGNRDDHDTVWCLDANSGKPIWQHRYACALDPRYYEGGPGGTPSVDLASRSVFTLSKKGHAFCLDLDDGGVRWKRDLKKEYELELPEWSFAGSPLVTEKLVILNVGSAGWALDKQNGKTVWRSETTRSGYATPVPFGDGGVAIFSAKELVVVDSGSGKIRWRQPWESSRDVNAADPIAKGDQLLITSSAGVALLKPGEADQIAVKWQNKNLRCYFNPGVLHQGHVYAIHGTTHGPTELVCLDAESGETKWAKGGFGSGGLVAAGGGKDVIVFDKGQLTVFRATPETFVPRLRMQVMGGKCWTSPVFAHGRIYCRNAKGRLACVNFK
jgi:outer membrane protein assembly factor BamB